MQDPIVNEFDQAAALATKPIDNNNSMPKTVNRLNSADESDKDNPVIPTPDAPKKATSAKAIMGNKHTNLMPGDPKLFYEGFKPANFDKTYGQEADQDLIDEALKHFNKDDGFLFLFNARANYLFSVVVPEKFRTMDDQMFGIYRAQVHSTLLKPGTEIEQIDAWCKKVVSILKYVRNR